MELGGANTYSGDTYNKSAAVAAPIKLIANEVIPNGPGKGNFCLYGNNTVLDLNGFNETINGLANNGTTFVDNTAPDTTSTLTFGDNNFSGWYSGKFRDTGSGATLNLVKTGSGIMILSGVNEHSGTTTINEGTLRLGGATALGTVDGGTIVNAGGALDLNDFALTLQEPLLLSGQASLWSTLSQRG